MPTIAVDPSQFLNSCIPSWIKESCKKPGYYKVYVWVSRSDADDGSPEFERFTKTRREILPVKEDHFYSKDNYWRMDRISYEVAISDNWELTLERLKCVEAFRACRYSRAPGGLDQNSTPELLRECKINETEERTKFSVVHGLTVETLTKALTAKRNLGFKMIVESVAGSVDKGNQLLERIKYPWKWPYLVLDPGYECRYRHLNIWT